MALTAQQIAYLQHCDQRFAVHIAVFDAYNPVMTPAVGAATNGTQLRPKPMPMVSPRKSIVANSGAITLYATDSYNRGGAYVGNANVAWANTGGAGTLVDNGDGTATWTAPAVGSGTNAITMTATNANGTSDAIAYVQYPKTTYDEVFAEVASLNGSVGSHGWKCLLRVRGSGSGLTLGKGVLLHIEDTWGGTTSTFGGYRYSEGNFFGYISQAQYFEDWTGESYLGLEVSSPYWILSRMQMIETFWGQTPEGGKFYINDFRPVDAIWHFVREMSDFYKYHNVTLWFDQNSIDDLMIDQSDYATIFTDLMARTVSTAYCDRYGNLLCVPDPDVRADEYWGTPSPIFDASTGMLDSTLVEAAEVVYHPYTVRKLTMEAIDKSKMGLWAVSENSASAGEIRQYPGRLLCDQGITLADWVVEVRAQMNRKWEVNATLPLNHVVDIMNFVDVNFTSPSQSTVPTASGRTWVNAVTYRPDIARGGWIGQWNLLKQTKGDGEAETGATSGWSGSGDQWSGDAPYSGDGLRSTAPETGGISSFCHVFDFKNSGSNAWSVEAYNWNGMAHVGTPGTYTATHGWSAVSGIIYANPPGPASGTASMVSIAKNFASRVITGMKVTMFMPSAAYGSPIFSLTFGELVTEHSGSAGFHTALEVPPVTANATATYIWNGTATSNRIKIDARIVGSAQLGPVIISAQVCGFGGDPFPPGVPI